jgi:quinol monooxygenase YgiN
MKAAPGKREELKVELEAVIEPTVNEDGCVNYDLHQGTEDPDTFVFYENWESAAALDTHMATPHLVRLASIIGGLLDENGLTINRLHRIA